MWHGSSSLRNSERPADRHIKGDLRVPFFSYLPVQNFGSAGFLDAITLQALRTNPDSAGSALYHDAHRLEIGIPAPLGSVVCMTDVVAGDRSLGAHGAYPCHSSTSIFVS